MADDEKSAFDTLRKWFAPVKTFWDGVRCIDAELGRHDEGDPDCPKCTPKKDEVPRG